MIYSQGSLVRHNTQTLVYSRMLYYICEIFLSNLNLHSMVIHGKCSVSKEGEHINCLVFISIWKKNQSFLSNTRIKFQEKRECFVPLVGTMVKAYLSNRNNS